VIKVSGFGVYCKSCSWSKGLFLNRDNARAAGEEHVHDYFLKSEEEVVQD